MMGETQCMFVLVQQSRRLRVRLSMLVRTPLLLLPGGHPNKIRRRRRRGGDIIIILVVSNDSNNNNNDIKLTIIKINTPLLFIFIVAIIRVCIHSPYHLLCCCCCGGGYKYPTLLATTPVCLSSLLHHTFFHRTHQFKRQQEG